MRLINTKTLELSEFFGDAIPKYAILSHTWGDEEVTFQEWNDLYKASQKAGFPKIHGACAKAREHGFKWVWVDTNCIDKTSSAELTEAINSMFTWYERAEICYAYLSDVPYSSKEEVDDKTLTAQLRNSRWFTRGWTLQELLAPSAVTFYAGDWSKLGSRDGAMADAITSITGIYLGYLTGQTAVESAPVSMKMSWLAGRTTTRVEDMVYCMLGLFDINIPLLYGEGTKAFTRLQNEIIKESNDHTIFCWTWTPDVPATWTRLLAPSPKHLSGSDEISIYSITNAGLSITLPVLRTSDSNFLFVLLRAKPYGPSSIRRVVAAIQVEGEMRGRVWHVWRALFPSRPVFLDHSASELELQPLLVMNRRTIGPKSRTS
ncbi:heterokaryon incompatibility protein-domain-containing protein [Podospora aff. communis PSN243]|uniref:Heterokaryon incompatibility protein-domain-containing protein n=1 Tax=Podospora aff. communis PSN243 TaxID=3040156 RepID=A0AAV9GQH3_9PEZI|nr:heterokaryon incompatibility protein-domain-containing protein [Podospora aff. communis PSN243]